MRPHHRPVADPPSHANSGSLTLHPTDHKAGRHHSQKLNSFPNIPPSTPHDNPLPSTPFTATHLPHPPPSNLSPFSNPHMSRHRPQAETTPHFSANISYYLHETSCRF